jgi:PTH1 family peptidyl-tRNA hydrolase
VGLGNPGPRYEQTRHNVGFNVVRRVADEAGIRLKKRFLRPYLWSRTDGIALALPLTYMNRSGDVLPDLVHRTGAHPHDVLVICDNMDLNPGAVRFKRRGTNRAHNGIASVMDVLGTGDFPRLYLGIGRPPVGTSVVDHVLSVPPEAERLLYESAVQQAAEAVLSLEHEELESVMNRVNQRQR